MHKVGACCCFPRADAVPTVGVSRFGAEPHIWRKSLGDLLCRSTLRALGEYCGKANRCPVPQPHRSLSAGRCGQTKTRTPFASRPVLRPKCQHLPMRLPRIGTEPASEPTLAPRPDLPVPQQELGAGLGLLAIARAGRANELDAGPISERARTSRATTSDVRLL